MSFCYRYGVRSAGQGGYPYAKQRERNPEEEVARLGQELSMALEMLQIMHEELQAAHDVGGDAAHVSRFV